MRLKDLLVEGPVSNINTYSGMDSFLKGDYSSTNQEKLARLVANKIAASVESKVTNFKKHSDMKLYIKSEYSTDASFKSEKPHTLIEYSFEISGVKIRFGHGSGDSSIFPRVRIEGTGIEPMGYANITSTLKKMIKKQNDSNTASSGGLKFSALKFVQTVTSDTTYFSSEAEAEKVIEDNVKKFGMSISEFSSFLANNNSIKLDINKRFDKKLGSKSIIYMKKVINSLAKKG